MIEYALVLSLFFMTVYGFIQFCLITFGFNNATYASRTAVRYAALHGSTATYTCTSTDISNIITQFTPQLPFFPSKLFTVGTTAYGTILQ